MRWKVLVVRPGDECVDGVVGVIRRVGVEPQCHAAPTRAARLAAVEREEWDVVIYDPVSKIPIELVYERAPAAAVVTVKAEDDMADELARLVANRADIEDDGN